MVTIGTTSADSFTTELQHEGTADVVFFVTGANMVGRSALSSQFLSIPQEDLSIPSKPTNLSIRTLTDDAVTLQWKHPILEVRINVGIVSCMHVCISVAW